ncbi:MAG: polyphenol oxidase family protein [Verrucomicrobiales bacterium]
MSPAPWLEFPVLRGEPIRAVITLRVPGVEVSTDKARTMELLDEPIRLRVEALTAGLSLVTAEQTHGNEVEEVETDPFEPVPVVDGLLTSNRQLVIGIAVADCCPVWLWTEDGSAISVVHAGRKGTEGGIAAIAAKKLMARTGCKPGALRAFFGPCIRPPHYEVDIPALLHTQLAEVGVENERDCRLDTASDLARFYSYRMEKGCTGRMLALGWLASPVAG